MEYCMAKYRDLGAEKGAKIQQVLIEMGLSNVSALAADRYGEFYAKVEAI